MLNIRMVVHRLVVESEKFLSLLGAGVFRIYSAIFTLSNITIIGLNVYPSLGVSVRMTIVAIPNIANTPKVRIPSIQLRVASV